MVMFRAVLWCAVALAASAAAYTVDCNHDYTDCDTELSKLTAEDEDMPAPNSHSIAETTTVPAVKITTPSTTTTTILSTTEIIESKTEEPTTINLDEMLKPKPRLLFTNTDDLQNIANALHNRTQQDKKKDFGDLSDVNLDGDEEEESVKLPATVSKTKDINDKFFSNLQAPFHTMLVGDIEDDNDSCKENDVVYKIGERVERGCDETCECTTGGVLECFPRCKHPYIRRGRRLHDPLCFESPVDECCSIIACATGNEGKATKLEVCRYENETHTVGAKWFIGCEQTCTCEKNSIVTCKPRCTPPPTSENCINVQDPNDACCEIQVCDVSHDAHEEPENITSSTTSSSPTQMILEHEALKNKSEHTKSTMRPLVLAEPIGSVKVLQNNTVQVNLIHANNSEDPIHLQLSSDGGKTFKDIELIYSNLILNLDGGKNYVIKTKETGTKFNFTITTTESFTNGVPTQETQLHNITKIGCFQDGQFYEVGEEFHIGCTELCECTGPNMRECAALVCPSHVGLELMSKGCVRWAPSPPAEPPNCCPRAARCLSDGTCYYKGVAVPNWTEVPVSVSGCEERCFCENGELDCQEACTPLPPLPPQTLRCPPLHRPAHVNISDEDCCKQWGCVPNAGKNKTTYETLMKVFGEPINYVTPMTPVQPTVTSVLVKPQDATESTNFLKLTSPKKNFIPFSTNIKHSPKYTKIDKKEKFQGDNITIFSLDDPDSVVKVLQPEPNMSEDNNVLLKGTKNCESKVLQTSSEVGSTISTESNEPKKIFVLSDRSPIQQPKQNQLFFRNRQLYNSLPKKVSKPPKIKPNLIETYFMPADEPLNDDIDLKPTVSTPNVVHSYISPSVNNYSKTSYHTIGGHNDNSLLILPLTKPTELFSPQGKLINQYLNLDMKTKPAENDALWQRDTKMHVLNKVPNPYQTVLLRQHTNSKPDNNIATNDNTKIPNKPYTSLDVDHFFSQLDIASEVNRNLGRSADKTSNAILAGPMPGNFPTHPALPSFLPTVPSEISYPNPSENLPDYDEMNNIHRPTLDHLPPGLPVPSYGDDNKKLSVLSIKSDSATSVKMLFGLPPVLVGLRGSVDLRYTDQADDDISHWYSQVFAPTDEVLTTPRLEFTLTGLKPATTYKIRGKLFLHNLPVEPESDVRIVRTLDPPSVIPIEEKRREVDSRLTVMEVNDTVAHISWRHFSEDELQLIDGIQVRYRPIGTPIYSMTELLHHGRSSAELHDLRPGTHYEASLVLVPPPRVVTELHDPGRVEFTTSPYVDPYNWTVTIEARAVGSEAAELTWRGVPSPAERWVRVYRAAHACGSTSSSARKEHDAFRLAARDLPPAVTLSGLEPNTRCRVWLELFLTNGKVKTSNVIEINTKSLDSPEPIDNEIESASIAAGSRTSPRGDYYGALVVVGVVAALGALTSLLLLLVVVRRHHTRSVAITPTPSAPRESSLPPYDNPAYKLELQQETMDL